MSTHFQEDEILGKAYDARLMRRLLGYLRPYRRPVILSVVLLLLATTNVLSWIVTMQNVPQMTLDFFTSLSNSLYRNLVT